MDYLYTDICQSSKTGKSFFWCVTERLGSYPLAYGDCETLEEAEEFNWALSQILRQGRKVIDKSNSWCAERSKQEVWIKENTKCKGEFVYADVLPGREEPFEIIKKTKKRLFVVIYRQVDKVLQLDRIAFETDDEVWNNKIAKTFYAQPYNIRCADRLPEAMRRQAELLGKYPLLSKDHVEYLLMTEPDFTNKMHLLIL